MHFRFGKYRDIQRPGGHTAALGYVQWLWRYTVVLGYISGSGGRQWLWGSYGGSYGYTIAPDNTQWLCGIHSGSEGYSVALGVERQATRMALNGGPIKFASRGSTAIGIIRTLLDLSLRYAVFLWCLFRAEETSLAGHDRM